MNPYQPPDNADRQTRTGRAKAFVGLLLNPTFVAFMAAAIAAIIVLAGALGMVLLW